MRALLGCFDLADDLADDWADDWADVLAGVCVALEDCDFAVARASDLRAGLAAFAALARGFCFAALKDVVCLDLDKTHTGC